jgi:DNA-binding transcriptional MocR family regulator
VPLIDDDVYGELHFGRPAPLCSKAPDREGLVMHVSSFSKCLAPGYRLGWVAAGRFARQIQRLKLSTSLAPTGPVQIALADYLKQGGYESHLRQLRRRLADQGSMMAAAVERHFPAGQYVEEGEDHQPDDVGGVPVAGQRAASLPSRR